MASRESLLPSANLKGSILKWAKFFGGTLAKFSLLLFHIRPEKGEIFVDQSPPMKGSYVFLVNGQAGRFLQNEISRTCN